jgi:hypothetical protein
MRGGILLVLIVAAGLLSACGSNGDESDNRSTTTEPKATVTTPTTATQRTSTTKKEPKPKPRPKPSPRPETGAGKFTGQDKINYRNAKVACGTFSPQQVAAEFNAASSSPYDAAVAYSESYGPNLRLAVFEGCLAGFK